MADLQRDVLGVWHRPAAKSTQSVYQRYGLTDQEIAIVKEAKAG